MSEFKWTDTEITHDAYPKVLIINSVSLNSGRAEAITMRSIFTEWPKDRLMELCFDGEDPSVDFGISSYVVPLKYAPLRALGNIDYLKKLNKRMKKRAQGFANAAATTPTQGKQRTSFLGKLRQWLALEVTNSPQFIPGKAKQAIRAFQPNVIYTISGGLSITRTVNRISKILDVSVVPHFMDNWQDLLEWSDNDFLREYKKKLDRAVQILYSRADCALVISDRMAEVYEQKWHMIHYPLMNSVDERIACCSDKAMSKAPTFVYAGGLHLDRWKALDQIGLLIDHYNAEHSADCKFYIYCPIYDLEQYKDHFSAKCVIPCKAVTHDQVHRIYENADVLVHAETSRLRDNSYVRYSLSTKLPEYLASNRPFLFCGPKDIYISEFLSEHDACFIGTDESSLSVALNDLLSDGKKRADKIKAARQLAAEFFSINRSTIVLYSAFTRNHLIEEER